MIRTEEFITRAMCKACPDTLFVFGDNMVERGLGEQAKEMRGEPNAVGIPTKLLHGSHATDFFRDEDLERARVKINAAFIKLFVHAAKGGDIVWPASGIGTGLAELEIRAPKIWSLIENLRLALWHF